MRFTPVIFASVAAASIYGGYEPEPVKPSSAVKDYDYGYDHGYKPSQPAHPVAPAKPSSVKKDDYDHGYKPSAPVSKKGWKTTTYYETECYTVTSASKTKVWTSVKAIPTICPEDDDDEHKPYKPSKSAPAAPHKPTKDADKDLPYCSAYTETCTVTVTATKDKDYPSKPTGDAEKPGKDKDYDYPSKPDTPASPEKPVKPSYPAHPEGGAKPSGTGSWTKPYPSQFTGAASAQKAGALLAGAGAVAAMLL